MSLIPAFQIGVWNAWIFVLYAILAICIIPVFNKSANQTGDHSAILNNKEKRILLSYHIIFLVQCLYSIFLPLKLGTAWFYAGLVVAFLGLVFYTSGIMSLATTHITEEPMTKGAYRFSRHPMYVSSSIMFLGVGIACASWLFILLTIAYAVLSLISSIAEERFLLLHYGDSYRQYMSRTPRWLGIPKSG